jgi:DNA-binding NarL/FixJ family response regulator
MPPVRLVVADAQALVADGIAAWLADEPSIAVTGHATSGRALLSLLRQQPADLVLIDVSLPEMDGIDTTRALRKQHPEVKVLAHSSLSAIEYVNSMLIEGASGYVVKSGKKDELIEAIRTVMRGERYISPAAQESVQAGYKYTGKRMDGEYLGLTEREREIIRLIALERTNGEIAAALFISEDTVKTHRKNLMAKLNVRSVAGLVKYAVDRCWI